MTAQDIEYRAVRAVAELMCVAARTAPKAKGCDTIATVLLLKEDTRKPALVAHMREVAVSRNKPGFSRDAANIELSPVVVLLGTSQTVRAIPYCGCCGFADCAAMSAAQAQCAFNPLDLGIALGAAVAVASTHHVDNRIMYSAGKAAISLNLFDDERITLAMAVPLSATGKNIYFDRA